jgi:adenosine deaminase
MLRELCTKIPKAELHVHLEGTFELDLMEKLASKHQVEVPQSVRDLKRADRFELKSFFDGYVEACSLIRDEEDFAEILVAYLERVAD